MHQLQQLFADTLSSGLRRKAITTPSKWAEIYRIMGKPFSGKWSFKRHPWLREMHDSTAQRVIGQKSAQMGFTEAVLNITYFKIDVEKRDCLYVLPAKTPDASDFSSSRFDAALELSPHLTNLFSSVKNVGHKRAGASNLYIRGANSRGGLKSVPVGFIVFDEVDEMNQLNITLAEERVSGQPSWQIWKISTPTVPLHGINKQFVLSTQKHFVFRCPHCSKYTELIFPECLVLASEDRLSPEIYDSYLVCKECKGRLEHDDKISWLGGGAWEPFGVKTSNIEGYYINQLYSMTVSPGQIAVAYLTSLIDKTSEQEFFNSKLGLPHVPKGAQVTDNELNKAKLTYQSGPIDGKIITMGVDQGTWLHYEICSWEFPKLGNDLNMNATCRVIKQGKVLTFKELAVLMRQYQVNFCVVDAQPERRLAYEFACEFWGYVKLCFYSTGAKGRIISDTSNPDKQEISVDRTTWLDTALNRFHTNTISLPVDVDDEYLSHIKNQVRRYEKDRYGNPVGRYVSIGPDHYGHARCYAEIALPCAAALNTNENIKSFL